MRTIHAAERHARRCSVVLVVPFRPHRCSILPSRLGGAWTSLRGGRPVLQAGEKQVSTSPLRGVHYLELFLRARKVTKSRTGTGGNISSRGEGSQLSSACSGAGGPQGRSAWWVICCMLVEWKEMEFCSTAAVFEHILVNAYNLCIINHCQVISC